MEVPPPHWNTPPRAETFANPSTLFMTAHLYRRSHTYTGHACLKSPSGRLSIHGQTVLVQATNQRLWYHLFGRIRGGKHRGDLTRMRTKPTYKGMTQPSTKNLKALGLWVFFHIYCSTFSFLRNVGLILTLEYLTISPSSKSPSSTLIYPPRAETISNLSTLLTTPHLYHRLHTYTGHACLKPPSGRLSIQGQTVFTKAANQRLWYHLLGESEGKTLGRSHKNENWAKPYKRMTPPSTQNLRHWVYGSSFLYFAQLSHSYPMWNLDSQLNT